MTIWNFQGKSPLNSFHCPMNAVTRARLLVVLWQTVTGAQDPLTQHTSISTGEVKRRMVRCICLAIDSRHHKFQYFTLKSYDFFSTAVGWVCVCARMRHAKSNRQPAFYVQYDFSALCPTMLAWACRQQWIEWCNKPRVFLVRFCSVCLCAWFLRISNFSNKNGSLKFRFLFSFFFGCSACDTATYNWHYTFDDRFILTKWNAWCWSRSVYSHVSDSSDCIILDRIRCLWVFAREKYAYFSIYFIYAVLCPKPSLIVKSIDRSLWTR